MNKFPQETRIDQLFFKKAQEEIEALKESVAVGSAADWPEYRWKVGMLKGMLRMTELYRDILLRQEGMGDEDGR